ncbi:MAG: leucine-rich repeat domain-containing protein [Bacteroidota bacterium]
MRGVLIVVLVMMSVTLINAQEQPPVTRTIYRRTPSFTPYTRLPSIVNKDSITKICINGNGRRRLREDSLLMYKNLEELELIDCKISRLPKKLMNKKSLTRLVISNNFPKRKLKLPKSTTIQSLTIRGDENKKLPRSYRKFKSLEVLQLSRNNMTKFPNISGCNKLVRLDLNGNKITRVPGSIGNHRTLKSLNVNNNKVSKVEAGIEKLTALEELSFYNNQLPAIPPMLYTMTSLKMIDLYSNKIPSLSKDVAKWKNLEILYIAHNTLYEVPEEIGQLKNLRELYIHHNMISKLPASIGNLTSLNVLRMNNNLMVEWPAGVTNLKQLTNLDCSYNELKILPIPEFDFRNLKILVIENNPWDPAVKKQMAVWISSLKKNDTVVLE